MAPESKTNLGTSHAVKLAGRATTWAWVPVPVLLLTIVALWAADLRTAYESPVVLAILNFTFSTAICLFIGILAAIAVQLNGTATALFLGGGALVMGASFLAAALAGRHTSNVVATVHNLGMLASGILNLVGATLSLRPRRQVRTPAIAVALVYVLALAFVLIVTTLAAENLTPPFFVQGLGTTPIRQVVLGAGIALFSASGMLLLLMPGSKDPFRRWYGLGLVLLAVGLMAIMVQPSLGSVVGWVGGSAQYLGGFYLLVAVATRLAGSGHWAIPTETVLRDVESEALELREAKAQLSYVLDGSNDGFWDWDIPSGRVKFSRRWASMLGYDLAELEQSLATWEGLIHPDDLEASRKSVEAHLRGETSQVEHEVRARHKAGRWVWILDRGKVVERDAAGIPVRMAGTHTDITERKGAEEALRHSEERLRDVLDASSDGYWERDLVKGEVFHSARMNEIMGDPAVDRFVATDEWFRRIHPDHLRAVQPIYEAVLAHREDRFDQSFRTHHADGSWRWVRGRGKVSARDATGRAIRLSGTITDINDGMVAQEALRKSEKHFRQLITSMPIPLAFSNSCRGIETINAKFTQVLGYTYDDIPTVDVWFQKAYPDEAYRKWVVEHWSEELHKAVGRGGEIPPSEYQVTCKDGAVRTMSISGTPVGENLLIVFLDVTKSKALQAQLALASRLTAMGTLVAGVAHEINNPLAAELANQGLAMEVVQDVKDRLLGSTPLDREAEGRLLEGVLEALKDAEAGGRRIARIVKDLSNFGRPDPRRTRVRLMDVVDESMRWLHATVKSTAAIRVDNQSAPDVIASAGQLEQVLVNLVTNAAKATPEGQQREIVVRLGPGAPGMARVEVIDQGMGIAPALMDRIFDPFFTTRQVGQGTGLGLSISHAIVTAHEGTLTVQSEVGKGSTFRVELPAAPAET